MSFPYQRHHYEGWGQTTSDDSTDDVDELTSSEDEDEDEDEYEHDGKQPGTSRSESTLKEGLLNLLNDVESAGSFSSYCHISKFANPGLYINAHGAVPLPLISRDAEAIIAASKQAPFGKGSETIVDRSVRNTWEIDAVDFECRNPAWEAELQHLAQNAIKELGVLGTAHAERYKLLLYEEGAFFKPHRDTEKVPGMFGTLVICLPSRHSGGEVYLSHAGKNRVIETAPTSEFDLTALAWYSDVTHEVRPVTSGYRFVITYNLVAKRASLAGPQSAASLDKKQAKLERQLIIWNDNFPRVEKLVYILDHKYTPSSLDLDGLKGRDSAICRRIRALSSSTSICLLLANLTHETLEYSCDEEYDEPLTTTIKCVTTDGGIQVIESMDVDMDEILQRNPFQDRHPDAEIPGEFTGNEGAPSTLRYHESVVVLIRKEALLRLIQRNIPTSESASLDMIKFLCREMQKSPNDARLRQHVLEISKISISRLSGVYSFYAYSDQPSSAEKVAAAFMELGIKLNFPGLFFSAIETAYICQNLGYSPTNINLIRVLAGLANKYHSESPPDWDRWLGVFVRRSYTITELRSSFDNFKHLLKHACLQQSFAGWVPGKLLDKLERQPSLAANDYEGLRAVLEFLDPEWFMHKFLPLFSRRASRELLTGLLSTLHREQANKLEQKVLADGFRFILKRNASDIALQNSDFKKQESFGYTYKAEEKSYLVDFLAFLDSSLALRLNDEVNQILEISSSNISSWFSHIPILQSHVPEFLRSLAELDERYNHQMSPTAIQTLVETLLVRLFGTHMDLYPKKCLEWTMKPDPNKKTERFQWVMQRRKHQDRQLWNRKIDRKVDKSRSPHITVLTKTKYEFNDLMSKWQKEFHSTSQELLRLNDELTRLLGDMKESILGKYVVPREDGAHPLMENSGHGNGALSTQKMNSSSAQPVAGVKRKASKEIINLEGD